MVGKRKKHAPTKQEHASTTTTEKYTPVLKKCKADSQNFKIMQYLIGHESITQKEAAQMFDCWRLPARIFELRKKGAIIRTEDIPTISKCASSSYARYYLEDVRNEV